ncbi:MAG TPA: hypothetical protein VGL31_20770 [Xanthobacteraceae bacterium]
MEWSRYAGAIGGECPNCGGGTFLLAKACPACGAPIRLRPAGLMVAGALVLLLVAIVVAAVAVLRWHQLAAATATGAPADAQIAAPSTADLSWLATAMSQCDAQAKADSGMLHFLVTPLVSLAADAAPWRAKSINDAGNAIVLRADDTLDGLKSGTLRIYPADYDFSIFDQASGTVYKWRASVGVSKFSTADPGSMSSFNVQFKTARGGDAAWGGSFTRQHGSCHWVNAIIDN